MTILMLRTILETFQERQYILHDGFAYDMTGHEEFAKKLITDGAVLDKEMVLHKLKHPSAVF